MRKAIQDYHHGLVEETQYDPKKMWKTINRVVERDCTGKSISSLNISGNVVTEARFIVEKLLLKAKSIKGKHSLQLSNFFALGWKFSLDAVNKKYLEHSDSALSITHISVIK